MSNGNARMIGAAVVVLAGAVMYGQGLIAYYAAVASNDGWRMADRCADTGIWFVVAGSVLFVVDYLVSWSQDFAARRPDVEREERPSRKGN